MAATTWCWKRWIAPEDEARWAARVAAAGRFESSFAWRPDRKRIELAAYGEKRRDVEMLRTRFGGRIVALKPRDWLVQEERPPLRFGSRITIYDRTPRGAAAGESRLIIPHGLAFGSGEHATTFMLLRELLRAPALGQVLDLGTGSGVLALAARRLGATQIVATDFDPEAVRTARRNETRNFRRRLVRWRCADVRRLASKPRFDLVMANLFSELLIEAAPRVAECVAAGGQLWLSGILRSQQDEVTAAYRRAGLSFARVARRGKWVLLCFEVTASPRSGKILPRKRRFSRPPAD